MTLWCDDDIVALVIIGARTLSPLDMLPVIMLFWIEVSYGLNIVIAQDPILSVCQNLGETLMVEFAVIGG